MKSKYSTLYDPQARTWSVIFSNDHDDTWYVYLNGIDDIDVAKEVAEAMNIRALGQI